MGCGRREIHPILVTPVNFPGAIPAAVLRVGTRIDRWAPTEMNQGETQQQLHLDGVTDVEPGPDRLQRPQDREIVGISYRQLDYWARTDLVRPSLAEARGAAHAGSTRT